MIPLLALLLSAFPVTKDYHFLAGPDGQIPLPEVRDTDTLSPAVMPGGEYRDGSYYVKRWYDSTGRDNWVCICLKTEFEPRLNGHCRPFSYAYYRNGWVARPKAYEGYDAKNLLRDECTEQPIPCGVFPARWRITPPHISVSVFANSVQVDYGRVKRTFYLGDTVEVRDGKL